MDEYNQYGMAMTESLSYGCIKKDNTLTVVEFNQILNNLSHDKSIGRLFIVDIKFHNINTKTLLFNELYPTIFEEIKEIWAIYFSTCKYYGQNWGYRKKKILSVTIPKQIWRWKKKKINPLYVERLHFLIIRTGGLSHTFTNTLRLNNQSYKRISCNESKKCLLKKTFTGYWKIALLQLTVETILIIAFF